MKTKIQKILRRKICEAVKSRYKVFVEELCPKISRRALKATKVV